MGFFFVLSQKILHVNAKALTEVLIDLTVGIFRSGLNKKFEEKKTVAYDKPLNFSRLSYNNDRYAFRLNEHRSHIPVFEIYKHAKTQQLS